MASDLERKIIRQVEYFFDDSNLSRDKFLQEKINENEEGWVAIEDMLKFKRLASLSKDSKVIADALGKSKKKFIVVSDDKTRIKRNPNQPLPADNEEQTKKVQQRTAYATGFPLDITVNDVKAFIAKDYGSAESVSLRTKSNHTFSGSCNIIFKDVATAEKFVARKSVKFRGNELTRKMLQEYYSDKQQKKERKKQQKEQEQAQKNQFPNGAIVQFSATSKGKNWNLEEIKKKLKEVSGFEIVHIDFNKEISQGYARFSKKNNAVDFVKNLTGGEVKVGDNKLKLRALEGDEEKEYLKKTEEVASQKQTQEIAKKRKGGNESEGTSAKQAKKGPKNK